MSRDKPEDDKFGTGNPLLDEWVNRMQARTSSEPRASTTNPVADWIAGGRTIAYNSRYPKIIGNANASLLFCQMWYWTDTPTVEAREGWFWFTQEEITEQTGLSRTEQETARKRLREMGILSEEKRGLPMKLWFRLEKNHFFELIEDHIKKENI